MEAIHEKVNVLEELPCKIDRIYDLLKAKGLEENERPKRVDRVSKIYIIILLTFYLFYNRSGYLKEFNFARIILGPL